MANLDVNDEPRPLNEAPALKKHKGNAGERSETEETQEEELSKIKEERHKERNITNAATEETDNRAGAPCKHTEPKTNLEPKTTAFLPNSGILPFAVKTKTWLLFGLLIFRKFSFWYLTIKPSPATIFVARISSSMVLFS